MKSIHFLGRSAACAALLSLVLTGTAAAASATPSPDGFDGVLTRAHAAIGESEASRPLERVGRTFISGGDLAVVQVPSSGSGRVKLSNEEAGLTVEMPELFTHESLGLTEGGAITHGDTDDSAFAIVEATDDGVRLSAVIRGSSAPLAYDYTFDADTFPALLPDGSAVLLNSTSGEVVGTVAAPWAVDARGLSVATHFVVDGNVLTQVVQHVGANYPVIADPSVSLGWKVYVRYNKSEVKAQVTGWRGTVNDKAKYASIFCAALIGGGAPGAVAAAACAVYIYEVMDSLMATFKSAAAAKKCMELQYLYNGFLVGWKAYSC